MEGVRAFVSPMSNIM